MSYANIDITATLEKGERLASKLPTPKGYNLLAVKPKIEEKTAGGILKPNAHLLSEERGAVACLVLSMGDMAYSDEARFPTGPWCAVGDFILVGAYRGQRFQIDNEEFILLTDDMVIATIDDPRGIGRVW